MPVRRGDKIDAAAPGVDDHVLLNGGIEIPVTAAVHGPVGAGLQEPETLRRAYRPGFFLVVRLNLPGVVAVGPVLVGLQPVGRLPGGKKLPGRLSVENGNDLPRRIKSDAEKVVFHMGQIRGQRGCRRFSGANRQGRVAHARDLRGVEQGLAVESPLDR